MAGNRSKPRAGLFDVRNVIGGLLGAYGLVLLLMGLFGDKELDKTGGVNANLWAGIVMLVIGLLFVVWTLLSPVRVVHRTEEKDTTEG